MAGDLGAYQLLFVGKERASSLSENRRTSTHKTASKDTERERKKRRDEFRIEEEGEDQEVEHCTSSTLGPP